jgi:DNA helicase II / ATP-dependent DNA helicase PcrA
VVIDEIQDLVGDRADFVLALLRRLDPDVGLTGLGDPLQGVFDFQLEQSRSQTSAASVFDSLIREFDCEQVSLGPNYRARGKGPMQVVSLGQQLRDEPDLRAAQSVLREFDDNEPSLGDIEDWFDLVTTPNGVSAVLCATNAEVLRVSKYFNEQNVRHAVRRQAQDFGAVKWIAGALGPLRGPRERRSDVEAALQTALGTDDVAGEWYLLKSAEGRSQHHDSLDLAQLGRLIRSRAIPLTLTEPDDSTVIVSTVHRAKGLEFDRVFLVAPSYVQPDEDPWAAVRRQYVALSRARDDIFMCHLRRTYAVIRQELWLPGRLLERIRNPKTSTMRTTAMEFQYNDIEVAEPGAASDSGAIGVQMTLGRPHLAGTRMTGILDSDATTGDVPSYQVRTQDGELVGRTSEFFNEGFVNAFSIRDGKYPVLLDGLSLVSVETIAGDPRASERAGLGSSGFWLAPRVIGLAQPDWSVVEEFS